MRLNNKTTVLVSNQTLNYNLDFYFQMHSVEMFLIHHHVSLQDKFLCCRFQSCVFDKPTQHEANISNHKQYFIPIVNIIRSLFWM